MMGYVQVVVVVGRGSITSPSRVLLLLVSDTVLEGVVRKESSGKDTIHKVNKTKMKPS